MECIFINIEILIMFNKQTNKLFVLCTSYEMEYKWLTSFLRLGLDTAARFALLRPNGCRY